jgi:co-chaperonin GroES (HSP10)
MTFRAIRDHVLVADMVFKERITQTGLILPSDDTTSAGIRPRWGKVVAVGQEQEDIKVGQYVLVKHGRWTRKIEIDGLEVRRIDTDDVLVVSDVPHNDETQAADEVVVDQISRDINEIYE